jgi:hypothetical protein
MHSSLLDSKFIREDIRQEARKQAMRSLRDFFDALPPALEAGDRIDLFYVNELCANRFSLANNEQIRHFGLAHPLLSADIWRLLLSLPSSYRVTNTVYKYLLHSLAPNLEKIPLDNSGFRVPYRGYRFLRYASQAAEKILQKFSANKRFSFRSPIYSNDDISRHNLQVIKEIVLIHDGKENEYFQQENIERSFEHIAESDERFPSELLLLASAKLLLRSL